MVNRETDSLGGFFFFLLEKEMVLVDLLKNGVI